MSRYEARPLSSGWWYVYDTAVPRSLASPCIEAEANIIAFALNTVAEGFTLAKGSKQITSDQLYFYNNSQYTGPTDGVAPS